MKVKDVIEMLSDIPLDSDVYILCGENEVSPYLIIEPITESCANPTVMAYVMAALENKPAEKMN